MIFSVFHKSYPIPDSPFLKPIYVGPNKEQASENGLRDDSGDNIAALNDNFCELTALYWLWKNYRQQEEEMIGFCHYRRYFIEEHFEPFISGLFRNNYMKKKDQVNFSTLLSDRFVRKIDKLLDTYEFILPYYHHLNRFHSTGLSIVKHYEKYHKKEDWALVKEVTFSLYPEYKATFEQVEKLDRMFIYNMFITRRKNFDFYCAWLFPIMFSVYGKIQIEQNSYQKRVMGFLSERLFNVFLIHNFGLQKIKKLPILSIID